MLSAPATTLLPRWIGALAVGPCSVRLPTPRTEPAPPAKFSTVVLILTLPACVKSAVDAKVTEVAPLIVNVPPAAIVTPPAKSIAPVVLMTTLPVTFSVDWNVSDAA